MHGHADSMGEGEAGAAIEMGACLDEAQQLSPQKQEKNVDLTTTCLHAVHVEDGIEQVTVTGSWYRLLTKDEIGQVYAVSPIWHMCRDVLRPHTLVAENSYISMQPRSQETGSAQIAKEVPWGLMERFSSTPP